MAAYWGMFIVPAFFAVISNKLAKNADNSFWLATGAVLIAFLGLRYEVGGDWARYLWNFSYVIDLKLSDSIGKSQDPGYYFFNWLFANFGFAIWSLNLFCAIIIVSGVMAVPRRQPLPWIALASAVPYTLIVVGMGYTRQAAALGFICWGMVAVQDRRPWRFLFYIVLAATFHKSAVVMTPLFLFSLQRIRFCHLILLATVIAANVGVLVLDSIEAKWASYVETQRESDGAAIRSAMNLIPASILLILRTRLRLDSSEMRQWYWMSIASLIMPWLVPIAGTAVDRISLYLLPLQMVVFSRLFLITKSIFLRSVLVFLVLFYFAVVAFVWFTFVPSVGTAPLGSNYKRLRPDFKAPTKHFVRHVRAWNTLVILGSRKRGGLFTTKLRDIETNPAYTFF